MSASTNIFLSEGEVKILDFGLVAEAEVVEAEVVERVAEEAEPAQAVMEPGQLQPAVV
jgi:hypothetical protein